MLPPLILGSSSVYRSDLLQRLHLPFSIQKPEVDESPQAHELPHELATRLSLAKAQRVSQQHPLACVIGSDQVLDFEGQCLGKPLNHQKAVEQLQMMQGKTLNFHSAVAVICPTKDYQQVTCVTTQVTFRTLSNEMIERYLHLEKPYDCAGSAKSEGLGITLMKSIQSDDPSALIGLPLIALSQMLREVGYALP